MQTSWKTFVYFTGWTCGYRYSMPPAAEQDQACWVVIENSQVAVASTAKTQLQQAIEQAYINMTSASDRYKTLLQQAEALKNHSRLRESRFTNGVGTTTDYTWLPKTTSTGTNINNHQCPLWFSAAHWVLDYYRGSSFVIL